jgi:hypothetical protein
MTRAAPLASAYPGFFQIAHVTSDLERAMALFRKTFGLGDFLEMREHTNVTGARLNVALAYLGPTMIEIIEPLGGNDAIYRDVLPGDQFAIRLHHLAKDFDTDEQYDAEIDALRENAIDLPILASLEETRGKCRMCYADLRPFFGYYVEYLLFTESGKEWLQTIPRY